MKYILYGHNGSANHGCEAIVRSFIKLFEDNDIMLLSYNPERDLPYGINNLVNYFSGYYLYSKLSPWRFYTNFREKVLCESDIRYRVFLKNVWKDIHPRDIAFSIGGDNYCYGGFPETLASYNRLFNGKGLKTVLFGCSIEPSLLDSQKIIADLKNYDLIISRESITYAALIAKGLTNVKYAPDTAFILDAKPCKNYKVIPENTVGINISPRVGLSGKNHKLVFRAYQELINYILSFTDMNIALIPHVVAEDTDDRVPLRMLQNDYIGNNRIFVIEDSSCEEIKYAISKCRFMIASRTHASIAAYSTCVPTLVLGYSVKSKGIAKDIFGDYSNYVIADTDITSKTDLVNKFKWLQKNEIDIRNQLSSIMPRYKEKVYSIPEMVHNL